MTTERYAVATEGGDIALELHHTIGIRPVAVAVFVPGAPRDASLTRTVTSAWESAIVAAVDRSDVAFITFNYLGVGESTGQMSDSSIAGRRAQVAEVIRFARVTIKPRFLILVGCSMGGHIVATLARTCGADGVALVVPAAYGSRAETLKFGPRLTSELRRPYSWRDSPAFAGYQAFPGRKLLIAPRDDEIIPPEITATYAGFTDTGFVWRPAGVGHRFLACKTAEDRSVTRQSIERVAAFVELCVSGAPRNIDPAPE
jgi:pimeloyl-ACP methyl ester carboxylesterase